MPFTLAHPAAVLPLRNRFPRALPWSALVIGSLTPDFKYFLLGLSHAHSHALRGLFVFCLPAGIVTWVVFQFVLKRPLTLLAPRADAARLWTLAAVPARLSITSMMAVALATVVGASSHLIWDSFTHADGWGVKHIHALSLSIVTIQGYQVTAFKLLQHGSTILGLLVLARAYAHWRRHAEAAPFTPELAGRRGSLALIVALPLLAGWFYSRTTAHAVRDLPSLQPFAWRFVTSTLAFGIVALVLYSLVVTLVLARSMKRPGP